MDDELPFTDPPTPEEDEAFKGEYYVPTDS